MGAGQRGQGRRQYSRHRLTTLRRAANTLGNRVITRRFRLGRALWQWRSDLVDDLGGPESVSTQQVAVVELAVIHRGGPRLWTGA
jgi:hypothetical protein